MSVYFTFKLENPVRVNKTLYTGPYLAQSVLDAGKACSNEKSDNMRTACDSDRVAPKNSFFSPSHFSFDACDKK